MAQNIFAVTVVVPDYDEALDFYVGVLGFDVVEDTPLTPQKRWVMVVPSGAAGCRLLLAKAASPEQAKAVGDQTGGRVFLFLATDDFDRDHARLQSAGVNFVEPPRNEPYGKVAVFRDPFGNLWDLVEYLC